MREYTLERVLNATKNRQPNFNNILAVLDKKKPSRPTLFEFFMNDPLECKLAQWDGVPATGEDYWRCKINAFRNAGYDYTTLYANDYSFKSNDIHRKSSLSANEGFVIHDRQSFEAYEWEDTRDYDEGRAEKLAKFLPDGMKFIAYGPGGVLENMIKLIGFDNLCYMTIDDPELVGLIADNIGQRLYECYEQVINCDSIGAIISNDDWGFNTQTMLSTADMRKYVFPWHKKIAALAHSAGKPVILHSCGNLAKVWDDIIFDIKMDGKHSYEDNILPVEKAYDELNGKIAVLGGIDVDFATRMPADDVYDRSSAMLKKTDSRGYALGTGNSIPEYIPDEKYFSMILAALDEA